MNYFKVNEDSNSIPMGNGWFLVSNELVTEKEAIARKWNLDALRKHSTVVSVSSWNTRFFFGVRKIITEARKEHICNMIKNSEPIEYNIG